MDTTPTRVGHQLRDFIDIEESIDALRAQLVRTTFGIPEGMVAGVIADLDAEYQRDYRSATAYSVGWILRKHYDLWEVNGG